jgi:hypothetical protein
MRVCINCQRRLSDNDLLERESQLMEAERISAGLVGVCFRYYRCPRCAHDHHLEVGPLADENDSDFESRKGALVKAVQTVRALRTTVVVVEQGVGKF